MGARKSVGRGMGVAVLALALAAALGGCALGKPAGPRGDKAEGLTIDPKTAELHALRPALRSLEDSLVLDILLGYRMLAVQAENTGSLDRETVRRARSAYNQLEYLLRQGGIKDRAGDARSYVLPGGERVTLRELLEQLSRAMLKTGADGDWRSASDRAREVQRHRLDLSALVEDAGWTLTLADALEGRALSEDIKRRLRFLHESYAMEVPHDAIVKEVNSLLPSLPDEKLRREVKKLANRSWERDRRKSGFKEPLASLRPDSALAPAARPGMAAETPLAAALPAPASPAPAAAPGDPGAGPVGEVPAEAKDRVDTLAMRGQYLEALRVLESLDGAEADWARDKRRKLGDRFCEEKRTSAANSFTAARKAQFGPPRTRLLQQSLSALDSCLFHFPDVPVSAKVRRNREIVEKELKR